MQVIGNWNGVCELVKDGMALGAAIDQVRARTMNMEPQEMAWNGAERDFFGWVPKI